MRNSTSQNDSILKGIITGLVLPIICLSIMLLVLSSRFDSFSGCVRIYQNLGILYKMLSLCMMPSAGLFFWWSSERVNKINQARGVLMMTLFYGVFVIILYII
jgi:hypothetical protein